MTGEHVSADADDRETLTAAQRRGALSDELGARHLAYRRALERLLEHVQQELVEVQATAALPEGLSLHFPLGPAYHAVRESRATFEAARTAINRADRDSDNA